MIRQDLRIDLDPRDAKGEALHVAITLTAPNPADLGDAPVVWFAWPGGGYNRRYYDLQLPGRPGYSQAEHHAAQGAIFVALDHIGVGDSALPEGAFDHAEVARTSAAAARTVIERLRAGALDLPALPNLFPVAMGQSYGGLLLTLLQAEHRLFQGVAMLGWSAVGTQVKDNSGQKDVPRPADMQGLRELNEGLNHPYRRSFHFDDVPQDIVAEDMRGYPARVGVPVPAWASVHMPGGPRLAPLRSPLEPGVVAKEAASIDVPVFVGAGEIDTVPDLRAEPAAYARSPDITTFLLPRAAHMHNFAGTRARLWNRLGGWASCLRDTARS